jgi:hypothetical protein
MMLSGIHFIFRKMNVLILLTHFLQTFFQFVVVIDA